MESSLQSQFIQFLENDLLLPRDSISLALRHYPHDFRLLPVVLWQYGLANLDEMNHMFNWLERNSLPCS